MHNVIYTYIHTYIQCEYLMHTVYIETYNRDNYMPHAKRSFSNVCSRAFIIGIVGIVYNIYIYTFYRHIIYDYETCSNIYISKTSAHNLTSIGRWWFSPSPTTRAAAASLNR